MIQDLSGYLFASKFYEAWLCLTTWCNDIVSRASGCKWARAGVSKSHLRFKEMVLWKDESPFWSHWLPYFGLLGEHGSSCLGVSRSYKYCSDQIQAKSRTCFDVFLDRNFKGLLNVRNEKHSIWYKSYICSGRGWKEKIVLHLTTLNRAFYFCQNYMFWWTIRLIWSMEKLQNSSESNLN